jgi:hypothetical protein
VEIVDEFDFSKPANVGPICLPPNGFQVRNTVDPVSVEKGKNKIF